MPTTRPLHRAAAAAAATIVTLVTLSGCGLFGGTDRPSLTESTLAPTTTVPRPETELLDAGEEPRQALRFDLGAISANVDVIVDLDVTQDGGEPVVLDLPPIRQRLRLTTTAPDADGTIGIEIEVQEASVEGSSTLSSADQEAVDEALAQIIGLRGIGRIDDRGRVDEFTYETPAGSDDDLATLVGGLSDQVAALVAPVPEEAVGVGARWRSTTASDVGGTSVPITTVYEITAIEGGEVTYSSTSEGTAADRPLTVDGLEAGVTMHLVELRSTGRGTGTFSLRSLAASADVRSETDQSMTLDGPDGSVPISQRTTSHLVVSPTS